ncbi:DUF5821 family protein [Haloferax sp. DFSO60]|uniref:transcriptional regulator TbsP domain-containing protein n=1 Tax=Haloferax sp. DFSO60 TaxID=3388652 RepID=UPI003979B6DC
MTDSSRVDLYRNLVSSTLSSPVDEMVIATAEIELLEAIAETLHTLEDHPRRLRLLTNRETVKDADNDFIISSRLSQYIEDGMLSLRVNRERHPSSVFVTSDEVTYIHPTTEDEGILLSSADGDVVIAVREKYISQWKDGRRFQLSKPSYARMLESIGDDLGESMEQSVQSVFESAGLAHRGESQMDEVDIYLLVGAQNNQQFYDICNWGEDMGIASRAKFSKHKRALEDAGLIDTEKVATDIGRPRQRLVLANDSLTSLSPVEVIQAAQSVL